MLRPSYLLFFILLCISCQNDSGKSSYTDSDYECKIRLTKEPGRIHPIFASTSIGRELFQYVFLPLADFHPQTMELYPILIDEIPEGIKFDNENGESALRFDIEFKSIAKWSDGRDITAQDYLFTIKAIKHPDSKATAWKPYLNGIRDVILDNSNPKRFSVIVDDGYMLAKESVLTTYLLPSHIYDPENQMENLSMIELNKEEYEEANEAILSVVENTNNSMNDKTGVVQNGPYKLTDFKTDLYVALERVEDYWGAAEKDNPYLQAYPQKMTFFIVPDDLAAVNMAKEAKLDFVPMKSGNTFLELQKDSSFNQEWKFHVPQLMMYLYLAINNTDEVLSEKEVRQALAHLADVDNYIENLSGGLGVRTHGYILPAKSYYNKSLSPVAFDIDQAKSILSNAGWSDSDGDSVLDKDGKKLEFELLITGSSLSKNLALMFQESAQKAGIKINITPKSSALMRQDNLSDFNFDMAALSITLSAAPDDPYSRWHSDNADPGERNFIGYKNPEADRLIELIRTTNDASERKEHYLKLQEVFYEDQPAIFLYSPLQKMMISDDLEAVTSSKRPGYNANTFRLIQD